MSQPIVTTDSKLNAALELLDSKGIWRINYAPPLWRWLWKREIIIPPPYMIALCVNALVFVPVHAVIDAALVAIVFPELLHDAPLIWSGIALALGLVCGVLNALWFHLVRTKHRLPLWHEFNPQPRL